MMENQLYYSILDENNKQLYMKIWWSDNFPANEDNLGCIDIMIFDEHMRLLDTGEMDYNTADDTLRDFASDCLEFMNINAIDIKETNVWSCFNRQDCPINKKGEFIKEDIDVER